MAGGNLYTASGTKIYIGPSVNIKVTNTLVLFQALTPWVEIGLVSNYGEYGDESNVVSGAAVGDGRVRKAAGAADAGTMALAVFDDATDAGQLALVAAQIAKTNFAFKIVPPDRPISSGSDSEHYFGAIVTSRRMNLGGNDSLATRTFNLAINTEVYELPADT